MTDRAESSAGGDESETEPDSTGDAEIEPETTPERDNTGHVDDIEDGAGCTEIWEHLSENRQAERD